MKTLADFFVEDAAAFGQPDDFTAFQALHPETVSLEWENLGGQLVPADKAKTLRCNISEGRVASWEAVHGEYQRLWEEYPGDKALNALAVLRFLGREDDWEGLLKDDERIQGYIASEVRRTRAKDFDNPFRAATYRSADEMRAVLGTLEDNPFIRAQFAAEETR
jgi:hypothetical protein